MKATQLFLTSVAVLAIAGGAASVASAQSPVPLQTAVYSPAMDGSLQATPAIYPADGGAAVQPVGWYRSGGRYYAARPYYGGGYYPSYSYYRAPYPGRYQGYYPPYYGPRYGTFYRAPAYRFYGGYYW